MTNKHIVRLSPEQFKAVIIGKGWTYKQLAQHWGISTVWLSNIARNPERSSHYDDAVMGLPAHICLSRSSKRRQQTANAYLFETTNKLRKSSRAYRYHDYLAVGAIISVLEDIGSMAVIGMRGCVFSIRPLKGEEEYGIIFENGTFDWFPSDFIDNYMAQTGLTDEGMENYKFVSVEHLQVEYSNRRFKFWP